MYVGAQQKGWHGSSNKSHRLAALFSGHDFVARRSTVVKSSHQIYKCSDFVFCALCRLLSPQFGLLPALGKKYRFELAAGLNGKVWIASNSVENTIYIANALERCEHLSEAQIAAFCAELLNQFEPAKR